VLTCDDRGDNTNNDADFNLIKDTVPELRKDYKGRSPRKRSAGN
jgi:hypothetical protein